MLLVKPKQQNLCCMYTACQYFNDQLRKSVFPLFRDCIEALGCNRFEATSVFDLKDAFYTL